jgi:polar amino acid transport system substrate-binding protein
MIRPRLFCFSLAISMLIASPLTWAAELKEIKHRGQLIVAVKNNLRPLGFINSQGKLVGLEIDMARRLAAELLGNSNAVLLKPVSNQERLKAVLNDQVDIAIATVTETTSRQRIVNFSPYYYLDGVGIITKNISVKRIEDLTNAKIIVLKGSSAIAVIKKELPSAQLIGVNSYQEALNLLETNQADAMSGDRSVFAGWIQEYPAYKILPEQLSGAPLCIVMPKGIQYQDLREEILRAIARWRESGWLQERIKYWRLP